MSVEWNYNPLLQSALADAVLESGTSSSTPTPAPVACVGVTLDQLNVALAALKTDILNVVATNNALQSSTNQILAAIGVQGTTDCATSADLTMAKNEILSAISNISTVPPPESSTGVLTGYAVINGVQYAALSAAATNAFPGSVVEIYGQMYDRQATAAFPNSCTIRGMTPDAKLEWTLGTSAPMALNKGLIVCSGIDQGYLVENLELCGATITSGLGANAAGVRGDSASSVTIQSCNIHNNQNGVLSIARNQNYFGNTFKDNGSGAGNTHGVYVNSTGVQEVMAENNTFYAAIVGNQFKSRAKKNTFRHNMVAELDGNGSWQVDISNGGDVLIEKNVIEQGANAQNRNMVSYAPEGLTADGRTNSLVFNDNILINDHPLGAWGVNIFNQPGTTDIQRNTFVGLFTAYVQNGGTLDPSNALYADRAAAGYAAYPFLPGVPV